LSVFLEQLSFIFFFNFVLEEEGVGDKEEEERVVCGLDVGEYNSLEEEEDVI
jgi:hypothetical protein